MSDGISFALNELPQLIADARFKADLPTMIYIHGFRENQNVESVKTIYDAYRSTDAYNIVMIDWSFGAAGDYFGAVESVIAVIRDIFMIKKIRSK